MPFEFKKFDLEGPILIEPQVFGDNRGFFLELYKYSDFAAAGIGERLVQDNYSKSVKGVLRGLHYQKTPKAQGKLIMCLRGRIFDVAVDLRQGSPWYGCWQSEELTEENRRMLYVPPGFAHGFQVLSDSAEILYKCTEEYSPVDDRGIIWNDAELKIAWPLAAPLLSDKDKTQPAFKDADINFNFRC